MKSILIGLFLPFALLARPLDIRSPNLEPSRGAKPRPPVDVPIGCDRLLSSGCKVSSSDANLSSEALFRITDGNKECGGNFTVKLAPGIQWIQLDLGIEEKIYAINIWRYLSEPHVFRDVIVQLSSDMGFQKNVETVFNNDHDNTVGLGAGTDKEYIETFLGRPIPVNGIKARYVRVYSNGSIMDQGKTDNANYCTEIEVYGEPYVILHVAMPPPTFTSEIMKIDKKNLEPSRNGKPRPPIFVPANVTNVVSFKCKVTSSDSSLKKESLSLLVDGNKEIGEANIIIFDSTITNQWIQLDFGQEKEIFALCLWHDYTHAYVYQNVVVQFSNDPGFQTDVATVFNNDQDDKLGFGTGQDQAYVETFEGRPIAVNGVRSRYMRVYGRCRLYPQIHYTEIEVYGRDPIPAGSIQIRAKLPKPKFY